MKMDGEKTREMTKIGKITKERDQATEEEAADGAASEEDKPEAVKITTEVVEEDLNLEAEEASEEEDEVFVGRNLLPLPRRCLRLGQEAKPKQ